MSEWTSKFRSHMTLDVPDDWSVEEYEDCASFASDRAEMIVDVNAHEMPESDLAGMLSILMRSPCLKVFDLAEVEVGGHRAWRFDADVIELNAVRHAASEVTSVPPTTLNLVAGLVATAKAASISAASAAAGA